MADTVRQLDREEQAKLEIGITAASPGQLRALVFTFLLVIVLVPLIQIAIELRKGDPIGALDIFRTLQKVEQAAINASLPSTGQAQHDAGLIRRIKVANDQALINIHEYEDDLKEESFLTRGLVTPTQAWMTRLLGQGNEKAYPGREGWTFFRDGVEYLTGPPFLDPRRLKQRRASGSEWRAAPEPDPLPAIRAFKDYLEARGIQLILMPVPVKPQVHPEKLSRRYRTETGLLQNPSWFEFEFALKDAGILLFDPASVLDPPIDPTASGAFHAQYLKTDTHWTPDGMDAVASALNLFIREHVELPDMQAGYQRTNETVTATGDIVGNLLQLEGRGVFDEETVTIQPVHRDGAPWKSDPTAELLLLGDSFANIYSLTNMNWGASAGLAEQLSYHLQRPVDAILINDAAAKATRQKLAEFLPRVDRLHGKKVVVWEFAQRELATGDWAPVDWKAITPGKPPAVKDPATPPAPEAGEISGVIVRLTKPPKPGTVTYKECVIDVQLKDITGHDESEALLRVWGMKNNKWTPAARWEPGRRITLKVEDYDEAAGEQGLDRFKQLILDDPDGDFDIMPWLWGTVK